VGETNFVGIPFVRQSSCFTVTLISILFYPISEVRYALVTLQNKIVSAVLLLPFSLLATLLSS
jgi:hypothetical protein